MNKPQLHGYRMGEGVVAFSSTRHGGCSEGNYGEFNINRYCGDRSEHIARNLEALKETLGVEHIIMPHQTHSAEVRVIERPLPLGSETLEGVDALVTDLSDICIGVSTADCIPILLYDEARHAVAAIHAGWRGTVKRIAQKTVETMIQTYGTRPADVRAVIGPGISLEAFEVGDEVYEEFREAGFPMESIARRFEVMSASLKEKGVGEAWHIDLPLCNRQQLEETGVRQVEMSGICTYQQAGDFFSARRLSINSGRIFTGIFLR